ncbi:MAG: cupin domain-containing protein [Undibacterium sp.]|uniref:cupin domain-containing protein n=1 Tax=Undibacterium sp. TaxID=1914977 RepID=UPI002721338A|nr:cupin domain-containing protein [Undibacterium sp.]MDO8652834.1 cupin domain-containing protein [Undibacterium sp.]
MAILHAHPGQAIDIHPLGAELPHARSTALFKTAELEVMRMILPAGKSVPPHSVPGEITLQAIEGSIEIAYDNTVQRLEAGQLIFLPGGVVHSLKGLIDASVLVTIVLKPR